MSVPEFDITKPRDLAQDAALAVDVLRRFKEGPGPFTPSDASRVINTIEQLYARVADFYALGLMVEEMAEVQQLVGKALRFGLDHARRDGKTARMMLPAEMGDVLASIDFACADGIAAGHDVEWRSAAKLSKLLNADSRDDQGGRLAPEPRGQRK